MLCNRLKSVIRTGWKDWQVKRERLESVAEHIFGVQMLALAMSSEYDYDIDRERVLWMLAVHELEEIMIGDLTHFQISREEKERLGHEAVRRVLSGLVCGEEIEALIREFDERKTPEAVFAYQCDKLECDLQCCLYDAEDCVDVSRQEGNRSADDPAVKALLDSGASWSQMWLRYGRDRYPYDERFAAVSHFAEQAVERLREERRLQERLFALRDETYRAFQSKLIPDLPGDKIIGIRTPRLRSFAAEFAGLAKGRREVFDENDFPSPVRTFLHSLPHTYYEEDNLHFMLLSRMQSFEACVEAVEAFLPYVDNWATCDLPLPGCFAQHKERLLPIAERWISGRHTYTIRYGIGVLLRLFLDEDFDPRQLQLVAEIKSEAYYVNMMQAWYFATALAKQWEETLPYVEQRRLPLFVHTRTIQKARESLRISMERKMHLRRLSGRIKKESGYVSAEGTFGVSTET